MREVKGGGERMATKDVERERKSDDVGLLVSLFSFQQSITELNSKQKESRDSDVKKDIYVVSKECRT